MRKVKEKVKIDCDLTLTSLLDAKKQLITLSKGNIYPLNHINVSVCVELIFTALEIKKSLSFLKEVDLECDYFFNCDRNMDIDFWSISASDRDTIYTIWSPGA